MNQFENAIALEKIVHREGMVHSVYNTVIRKYLLTIESKLYAAGNLNPVAAEQELQLLIEKINNWFMNNPGVNLDNIIL